MNKAADFVEEQDDIEDDSVAASIDAAWAEHERADGGGEGEVDSTPEPEPETDTPEEGAEPEANPPGENVPTDKDGEIDPEKPPVGLSAEAREVWKDAPKALKAEIAKRERDYSVGLQKNAEWATRAQQMDRVLDPYKGFLATNGGAAAIPAVLERAMTLQMGTPNQRAQAAADIINQFGVDIHMLDTLLSGGQAPQAPQMSENERWMADFRAQQEQQQHWQQQQHQNEINNGVGAFMSDAKNEFARDVSGDMADILEMAARRGVVMTLDQAYERACQMRPDIAKIINNRNSTRDVAQRRRAASSIHGSPTGSSVGNDPGDLRATIEAAFDRQGQV